ncbi:MAG TPA: RNA-binding protein [Pedobacter sp.]|jgi:RNA recognition motif-containing protein
MKIFIKGLPTKVEESELKEVFGDFGYVKSIRIIKDRETGESRGFGFVEMPNDAEAKDAIANMNGGDYYGQRIMVSEAKEDPGFGNSRGPGGAGGGARNNRPTGSYNR